MGKLLVKILPHNRTTICKILNSTDFQIKIEKDRPIGRIMKLDANSEILDCNKINNSTTSVGSGSIPGTDSIHIATPYSPHHQQHRQHHTY